MSDNRVNNERRAVGKGDWGAARGDHSGATVVSGSGMGELGEAALKEYLFHGMAKTLTLLTASGNTIGHTAAEAVTATGTSLFNPTGSGVNLVLRQVRLSVNSGTFAAGGVWHGVGTGQTVLSTISGAKAGTNANLGKATSAGRIFEKATSTTYTGASAVTEILPFAGTTATAAANGYVLQLKDDLEGGIVIPPGAEYRPLWTAVGTTVIYNVGYSWIEIPTSAL